MSDHSEPPHEVLFYEAIELPEGDRARFLDEACGGNQELRAEVDELLRAHDGAAGFLPGEGLAAPELAGEVGRVNPERTGDHLGPYKLLEQIGEGGFGTVWVAEQEKPVRRRVALKIIKPGMDTKEVIARFEQERQALAMMDHPNIARVLDAGATPMGRPFFVMELVRGIRITEFCDQANLPTAERLRIFIAVCHAVQHAHQKGIIHRDLKPSNILVTLHDGVPVPKVIDFGIAKATQQQRLTDLTIYTQFEQLIGTPLYMSPEQVERSGLDIDTRSDIYSLGVLLYELLVGRTPFDPETLMKRGLDEIRRVVREQEPQKPSTFVSTMAMDLRSNLAQHRQTDGAKLVGQIRGDLDWIVMKALEKDRARRYDTATGLAEDIQRHLLSEPVQARPPTMGYRFRRFVKRNKIAFGAGTGIAAALLIGMAVSTWMFFKEKQARERAVAAEQKATTEVGKSQQVAQFLKDMLKGVGPSVALGRDTTMLREILDKTAERVGKDLKDQPEVEAELLATISSVYFDLGEWMAAEEMGRRALSIRRKRFGNEHPAVARSLLGVATRLQMQGKNAEAEIMHREALAMQRKLLGNGHADTAVSLLHFGNLMLAKSRFSEAEAMFIECLETYRKLYGNESLDVALSLHNLASALDAKGKSTEAETMYRESLEIRRKLSGNEQPEVARTLNNLADLLPPDEKEAMLREALAIRRKVLGSEHPDLCVSLRHLAIVLANQGKPAEAESLQREALAITGNLKGNEHPDLARELNDLAFMLGAQSKITEAKTMYRESLEMRRKLSGNEQPEVAHTLYNLATFLPLDERESMLREALAIRRKVLGSEHPDLCLTLHHLAAVLQVQGKLAEAESLQREGLAMTRKLKGNEHLDVATSLKNLATIFESQEKLAEAETMSREALAIQRKLLGNEHSDVAKALHSLAIVLAKQGKLAEAEALFRKALAMQRKLLGNEHSEVAISLHNLASLLRDQGRLTGRSSRSIARLWRLPASPRLRIRCDSKQRSWTWRNPFTGSRNTPKPNRFTAKRSRATGPDFVPGMVIRLLSGPVLPVCWQTGRGLSAFRYPIRKTQNRKMRSMPLRPKVSYVTVWPPGFEVLKQGTGARPATCPAASAAHSLPWPSRTPRSPAERGWPNWLKPNRYCWQATKRSHKARTWTPNTNATPSFASSTFMRLGTSRIKLRRGNGSWPTSTKPTFHQKPRRQRLLPTHSANWHERGHRPGGLGFFTTHRRIAAGASGFDGSLL